jgi:hypothetical protein
MKFWFKLALPLLAGAALIPVIAEVKSPAPATATAETAISQMTKAALDFLSTLDESQKGLATFPLDSEERENWHYVPIDRKGLPFKDMRQDQQHLAYGLLHSALSHEGFRKATQIMSLEKILFDLENQAPKRDATKYYFSIFGTPAEKGTWAWRFEGHHMSMNFTIIEGKHIAVTPSFLGANPGEVASGPRQGLQVLEREGTVGFDLLNSLDDAQKKTAIIQETAPDDVITKEEKRANPLSPTGLCAAAMTPAQQAKLQIVIEEYFRRYRGEIADVELAKIRTAGWNKLHFAWAGATKLGAGHYYRVQGDHFLIEYDNTQNNAKHPHAVLRDFANDFGIDLLKKHFAEAHQK